MPGEAKVRSNSRAVRFGAAPGKGPPGKALVGTPRPFAAAKALSDYSGAMG